MSEVERLWRDLDHWLIMSTGSVEAERIKLVVHQLVTASVKEVVDKAFNKRTK